MRDRARAVIIGGGITGCSVAYHLARAGWSDLVLLDKGALTSGSTCHAAGLVTQFNPSPTMMRFRRYSIELYRELGVFETRRQRAHRVEPGVARRAAARRLARAGDRPRGRARLAGRDARACCRRRVPESLYGSVYLPGDGNLDPHSATYALAGAARDLGAEIRTGERVTGIELGPRHEVRAVLTESGRIETEVVVNAAGMWAPQVAAMVGAQLVSTPVEHQHIALAAVRGPRAAARPAVLPRPRLPRLRQVRGGRRALRRLRARSRRALARRRPVGSQRAAPCRPTRRASRRSCRAQRSASRSSPTPASSSSSATPMR